MSWKYRVVKREWEDEVTYGIHEAYYDVGEDKPHSITKTPVYPQGETLTELKEDFRLMEEAFSLTTLNYEDF